MTESCKGCCIYHLCSSMNKHCFFRVEAPRTLYALQATLTIFARATAEADRLPQMQSVERSDQRSMKKFLETSCRSRIDVFRLGVQQVSSTSEI